MGIACYVRDSNGTLVDSFPVAGATEVNELWLPVIQNKSLKLLEVIVTGGLTVSAEYHAGVTDELTTLMNSFNPPGEPHPRPGTPADRCLHLIRTLAANPPNGNTTVYVG